VLSQKGSMLNGYRQRYEQDFSSSITVTEPCHNRSENKRHGNVGSEKNAVQESGAPQG